MMVMGSAGRLCLELTEQWLQSSDGDDDDGDNDNDDDDDDFCFSMQ